MKRKILFLHLGGKEEVEEGGLTDLPINGKLMITSSQMNLKTNQIKMTDYTDDEGMGSEWMDQTQGDEPVDNEFEEDWTDKDWHERTQGTDEPLDPVKEEFEEVISKDESSDGEDYWNGDPIIRGTVEHEPPIEKRASEAEKLYANLLMVTDFEREFIEEVLEFKPDEESRMRIDELCRRQREIEEAVRHSMPPTQTTTIMI